MINLPDAKDLPGNRSAALRRGRKPLERASIPHAKLSSDRKHLRLADRHERAYDARIARIKEITGTDLRNLARDERRRDGGDHAGHRSCWVKRAAIS